MRGDSSDQVDRAWREHSTYLIARCRAWMHGDRDHAQEAFSRAWLRAAGQLPLKCGEIVDVRRWLTRIAYHACMDLYREIRRRAENSLEEQESAMPLLAGRAYDPERRLLEHERLIVLQTACDELPERLRNAMQHYLQSASYREMARHLGITEENARKRVQEARTILRRWLADYEAGDVRRRRRRPAETRRADSPLRTLAVRTVARRLPGGAVVHEQVFLTAATPPTDGEKLRRYVERHPRGWKRALELAHVGRPWRSGGRAAAPAEGALAEAVAHAESARRTRRSGRRRRARRRLRRAHRGGTSRRCVAPRRPRPCARSRIAGTL
jgi:RNA polymerase sigma-70 factor (ECF subfamily)